ncbi:MAG: hypothetical protein AAGE01_06180 [Pseudomonadota bacterium]
MAVRSDRLTEESMETRELQILRQLLNGIDPVSGRRLSRSSPYRRPEIVDALNAAVAVLEEPRRALPAPRSGMPWTPEEERSLTARFEAGETIGDIAGHLERSPAAITARLIQLELIEAPAGFRLRFGPTAPAGT